MTIKTEGKEINRNNNANIDIAEGFTLSIGHNLDAILNKSKIRSPVLSPTEDDPVETCDCFTL